MFCPYCGFEIADGFRFCPKCGKAMPDIGGKSPTADPCPIGRYAQSRNTDQNADGWNRAHAKQSCKTRAHQPQWRKRFIVDCETSNKKCLMLVVLGVIVCMVGWSIIDASTVYASFQIRDSEYLRQYGQNGPSFLQWLAFLVGLMLDIGGIAYVYIAWSRLMSRVRPIWNLPPIIAKPIAIAMCVIVYVALIAILTLLKGTARPSVWDYLIFVAMCKAIWRFFVREMNQGANINCKGKLAQMRWGRIFIRAIEGVNAAGRWFFGLNVFIAFGIIIAMAALICWVLTLVSY